MILLAIACAPAPESDIAPADLGPDRFGTIGENYTFDARETDADLSWSLRSVPAGSRAALSVDGASASLVPDVAGNYEVVLQSCVDDLCSTDIGLAVVREGRRDGAPHVLVDDQVLAFPGEPVTVDATDTVDPDGDALAFRFAFKSLPPGSALEDADLVPDGEGRATFTPDVPGDYGVRVFVDDGEGEESATTFVVQYLGSGGPTANAGADQLGAAGDSFSFDGSASTDPDGDPLTYTWGFTSLPAGTTVSNTSLATRFTSTTSFTSDINGVYKLRLKVNDGSVDSYDYVTATTSSNHAPTSSAGADQAITLGSAVTLTGSGSDPEGATLTYRWAFMVLPAGTALTNTSISGRTTANAGFTPDVAGTYRLRLRVSDGVNNTDDYIDITVTKVNTAPVASAVYSTPVNVGDTVTLDGTGSYDPDGDAITYRWVFTAVPVGSALTNASISGAYTASASFVPDIAGTYKLKLVVNDGKALGRAFPIIKAN